MDTLNEIKVLLYGITNLAPISLILRSTMRLSISKTSFIKDQAETSSCVLSANLDTKELLLLEAEKV